MSPVRMRLMLICSAGAAESLAKLRDVLQPIENTTGRWPTVEEWEQVLPPWFVSASAPAMSPEQAKAWVERWRTMSKVEQSAAVGRQRWSLPDWLYWMEPDQAVWRWASATIRGPKELEVILEVDGWPVPLESFQWLAKTAGADDVRVLT
jgi:hypothetical protein